MSAEPQSRPGSTIPESHVTRSKSFQTFRTSSVSVDFTISLAGTPDSPSPTRLYSIVQNVMHVMTCHASNFIPWAHLLKTDETCEGVASAVLTSDYAPLV